MSEDSNVRNDDDVFLLYAHLDRSLTHIFSFLLTSSLFRVILYYNNSGGVAKAVAANTDNDRAEQAIYHGIEKAEHTVQKSVEKEVNALFHGHDDKHPHKETVALKAKTAVSRGAHKVRESLQDPLSRAKFHEEKVELSKPPEIKHKDVGILHAVEVAELAVLHAVQEEVHSLFHDLDDKDTAAKANKAIKQAVANAKNDVEKKVSHRREWLIDARDALFEEYANYVLD